MEKEIVKGILRKNNKGEKFIKLVQKMFEDNNINEITAKEILELSTNNENEN